jgi:hypothetical protein
MPEAPVPARVPKAIREKETGMATIRSGLILGGLAILAISGCGGGGDSGPLTAQEKSYIKEVKRHERRITEVDSGLTTGTLQAKGKYPTGGLPTEINDATGRVLNARSKLVHSWDDTDCPTERLNHLCTLWYHDLVLQYRWEQTFVDFVNAPFSKAEFRKVIAAGQKETTQWRHTKAEIQKIQHEAATG